MFTGSLRVRNCQVRCVAIDGHTRDIAQLVCAKLYSEIYIQAERLNIECNVFQAELFAIHMAIDRLGSTPTKKTRIFCHPCGLKSSLICNQRQAHNAPHRCENQDNFSQAKTPHLHFVPLGKRTCRPSRKRKSGLFSQDRRQLQDFHCIQPNSQDEK